MRLRHAVSWSIFGTVGVRVLNLGATLVLARILTPEHFGLVALVGTLTTFFMMFGTDGVAWAIVQQKNLSEKTKHNAFWLSFLWGCALFVIVSALGPLAAQFYGEPIVAKLTLFQSLIFIFAGLNGLQRAILKRDQRMKELAIVEVLGTAVSSIAGLGLALVWRNVWVLASIPVMAGLVRLLVIRYFVPFNIGKPVFDRSEWAFVKFGALITGAGIFVFLSRNLDDILVAKFWGATQLAFYSKAYFIIRILTVLPTSAFADALIPRMSSADQKVKDWASEFHQATITLVFLLAPACVGIALLSEQVVYVAYGSQWIPAGPMLFWMGLAGAMQPIYATSSWLLISTGRGRAYFYWNVVVAVLLGVAFSIAAPLGAVEMSIAYFVGSAILLALPAQVYAHRLAKVSLKPLMRPLIKIGLCTALMAAVIMSTKYWVTDLHWVALVFIKIALGAGVYLSTAYFVLRELPLRQPAKMRK